MAAAIIVPVSFFLVVFAITYLYFSTRNKERMALIEKGADASIFLSGKTKNRLPFWKVFLLNFALLLFGTGLAIFIGSILQEMRVDGDVAYPGAIFTMAGISLLIGFFLTKKMDKEE